jgi:DNA modification methylase
VIKNLITLLSEPGDLIIDPFAGYGTILSMAKSLDRSAIGWEIDADCVHEANKRLQ